MTTGLRVAFDVTIARTNRMGSGMYARQLVDALRPIMGERLSPIDFRYATPFAQRKTARDRLATLAHDIWWTQVATLGAAHACDARLLQAYPCRGLACLRTLDIKRHECISAAKPSR